MPTVIIAGARGGCGAGTLTVAGVAEPGGGALGLAGASVVAPGGAGGGAPTGGSARAVRAPSATKTPAESAIAPFTGTVFALRKA
jgi:hypothetical protein